MNFNDRKNKISLELSKFLERYSPPRAMSLAAQEEELDGITTSLAKKMPVVNIESFDRMLNELLGAVADNAKTRAWPTQSEFVAQISKLKVAVDQSQGAEVGSSDWSIEVNAKRMTGGDPIGEDWLFGRKADLLVEKGVNADVILRRRNHHFDRIRKIYRSKKEDGGYAAESKKARRVISDFFKKYGYAKFDDAPQDSGTRYDSFDLSIPDLTSKPQGDADHWQLQNRVLEEAEAAQ